MARSESNVWMTDLVEDILGYLQQSHKYYLDNALVSFEAALGKLVEPCTEAQKSAVWIFFNDYKKELEAHFEYEEGKVIPYIKQLLAGSRLWDFSIDDFKDNHANIDAKLSDLNHIIMQSLPQECDRQQRRSLQLFISGLQKDLERHTSIEEDILIPMVGMIEESKGSSKKRSRFPADSEREPLSGRETEVLVSVAKGMINKEIADSLNISVNTVITHRKNITRKTGIKTVPGLTAYAILNNLVDISEI